MYWTWVRSLKGERLSVLAHSCHAKLRILLLLVVLHDFVSVILNTTDHFIDEISRLRLKEPTQGNNAFRNSTEVAEERRISVCLAEIIDGVRSIVKLSHKLRGLWGRFPGLCRNVDEGTFSLESLQDGFGLLKLSTTEQNQNLHSKTLTHLLLDQATDLLSQIHEGLNVALDQIVEVLNLLR